jgi:hypothetical protein
MGLFFAALFLELGNVDQRIYYVLKKDAWP